MTVRYAVLLLAASAVFLAAAVGGCRNQDEDPPVDGHIVSPIRP